MPRNNLPSRHWWPKHQRINAPDLSDLTHPEVLCISCHAILHRCPATCSRQRKHRLHQAGGQEKPLVDAAVLADLIETSTVKAAGAGAAD